MPVFYSPESLHMGLAYVGTSVLANNSRSADSVAPRGRQEPAGPGQHAGFSPSTPDAPLLQPLLLPLLVVLLRLHAAGEVPVPSCLLPGPAGDRRGPPHRGGSGPALPGLRGEPQRKGAGAGRLLAAVLHVPAAHPALLPDGRGDSDPAPGESRARPLPALPAGPDPGLLPGSPGHDPKVDGPLSPATAGQSAEPAARQGDERHLWAALLQQRAARVAGLVPLNTALTSVDLWTHC